MGVQVSLLIFPLTDAAAGGAHSNSLDPSTWGPSCLQPALPAPPSSNTGRKSPNCFLFFCFSHH